MEFPEISWVAVREEIESIETVRTSGKLYKVFPASQAKEISHDLAGAVALLQRLQECAVESGQYTKKQIYGE